MHDIHVKPLNNALRPALLALAVGTDQRDDMGNIVDLIADADACPEAAPMVICRDSQPIGYYRIDPHPRSVTGHDFGMPALGLRAFFIDRAWQGLGLATRALRALLLALRQSHPDARLLVLSVSVDNAAAQRLYQQAGFRDGGELYHGGRTGPQQLLMLPLH